jgi:hypothetical protein
MSAKLSIGCALLIAFAIPCADQEKRKQENPGSGKIKLKEPERMQKARAELHADFERLFRADVDRLQVRAYDLALAKQRIERSKDFQNLFHIRFWSGQHPELIIPYLVDKLDDTSLVGLENSADLIIIDRILSKDLHFHGHGWRIDDDLFTVAGRASWLLREITGERFGAVKMKSTKAELADLKDRWSAWLKAATVTD